MRETMRLIDSVAATDSTVLLLGESGVGKEVVARTLHDQSARSKGPFIAINCSAIPAGLLESELFGHARGAFTGAGQRRCGKVEAASGGTVFLDEIGDLPAVAQVKLLRVIQEKVVEPVGEPKPVAVDIRIIAATKVDLEAAMKAEQFRADLFYRLNVFPIEIPPLRKRTDDFAALIDSLTDAYRTHYKPISFSANALRELSSYAWPGNIRELGNLIERLSILFAGQVVDVDQLPQRYRQVHVSGEPTNHAGQLDESGRIDLNARLRALEHHYIVLALDETHGVVARAASRLGLARSTLIERMRLLGISATQASVDSR